jgi:hypothetical protein
MDKRGHSLFSSLQGRANKVKYTYQDNIFTGGYMKKSDAIQKAIVLATLIFLVSTSTTQALVRTPSLSTAQSRTPPQTIGAPTGIWEDHFNNTTRIDPSPPGAGQTDNYVISNSRASMAGTYSLWTDPAYTRLKLITLTNSGPAKSNYVIKLTITYDSDMLSDFRDLRFKHESTPGSYCNYWIEYRNTTTAIVWVKISSLPVATSTLYMFYGNSGASSVSSFLNTFGSTWTKTWPNGVQISSQPATQYAWNPSTAYGNSLFLATWEEGTGGIPWYQAIEGKIYDTSGTVIVPVFNIAIGSYPTTYRYQNPAAAYGGSNYLVAYTTYTTPSDLSTADIHARIVHQDGAVGSDIIVCASSNVQDEAAVTFDPVLNRFTVVWEDYRLGSENFNIYARQYDTSGTPIGTEKLICGLTSNQMQPTIAFDRLHNQYLIAWEEGASKDTGPFSINAQLFNRTLSAIGSAWVVASGTSSVDNDWPNIGFAETSQRYLIAWNIDDISSSDLYGNILGHLYNYDGTSVAATFTIDTGEYHSAQVDPYLNTSLMVSYNSNAGIFGKLVGTIVGELITSQIQLCSSSAITPDHVSSVVGAGRVFSGWEDNRLSGTYETIFGNMNILNTLPLDTDVTATTGTEQSIILSAHITSTTISPQVLNYWNTFNAIFSGNVVFSVLDGTTGAVLIPTITSGSSLSGLSATSIRLKATFTRTAPSTSPYIEKWNTTWVSNFPPNPPTSPTPSDGATQIDINTLLTWTATDPDGDTTTSDIYFGDTTNPPKAASNLTTPSYTPGTLLYGHTYYWRIVVWDEHAWATFGPLWQFTTDALPNVPSNPTPPDGTTSVELDQIISWTGGDPDIGDTVVYDVYFGTTTPPPLASVHQYADSFDPGALDYITTYHWQIVSFDSHGATTPGPIWNFTTVFLPNTPPYVPSSPSPPDGTVNISLDAVLSWTGGDPDPIDTVTYDIYLGTTNPPPLIITGHTDTTYDPPSLSYLTHYYWQIVSWDNRGASTPGPVWQFTTVNETNYPPYIPSDPVPPNHGENISLLINLSWACVDPNPDNTITYDVYFGAVTNPPIVAHNYTTKLYNPGVLDYETHYYWRITAWDNYHANSYGPIWDFTTEIEVNYPPYTPHDPFPADESVNNSPTVDLTWVSGDPNPHDTVTYDVYFGNTSTPVLVAANLTTATYDPGRLIYNTTYYWMVVARDNHGNQTAGPLWVFTVMLQPPDVTPPTLSIFKPGKAIYIKNVKLVRFFTTVAIGYIDVMANASDNETDVNRVEFLVDGVIQNTSYNAPYLWSWREAGVFFYTLSIRAWDNAGNKNEVSMRVWKFM